MEELAGLSPPEMAELACRFRELRGVSDRGEGGPCRNADLIRFFESHTRAYRGSSGVGGRATVEARDLLPRGCDADPPRAEG
jgi:hypothetical protein